jgi:hypothetical protein
MPTEASPFGALLNARALAQGHCTNPSKPRATTSTLSDAQAHALPLSLSVSVVDGDVGDLSARLTALSQEPALRLCLWLSHPRPPSVSGPTTW